jgi:hypothetical protein
MSAAASALVASGAFAQNATTDTDATAIDGTVTGDVNATATATPAPEFTSISEMTVGDLVGQKVYETNGESIGDIDYVIGVDGSASAIVGIGGFLGLGEYTVALPLSEFTYDAAQQMVTLDTTKDALKERPEFDESNAESLPDETPLADLVASDDTSGAASSTVSTDDSATSDEGAMSDESMESDDSATSDESMESDDSATSDDASDDTKTTTD